jgi:hypothetical protein
MMNIIRRKDVGWIQLAEDMVLCQHDNETSGSIKGTEFFQQVSDYQLLNKDSALCSLVQMIILSKSFGTFPPVL